MGEAGSPPAPSLKLRNGMNPDDCMNLPFPLVLLGQGQEALLCRENPIRLSLSVLISANSLVFQRNHLPTSGPAGYEFVSFPPKGGPCYLKKLPFWLRR